MDHSIGTAGWAIPRDVRDAFPPEGTALQRYAARFACVEINSTFYRSHRASTYARWAADVPASFRFALKVPKEITHVRRLSDCRDSLARFLDETAPLGQKRGPMLVQLPPKLGYDAGVARAFFSAFRELHEGTIVCEARNAEWFSAQADALLGDYRVARVCADPAVVPEAAVPGGWRDVAYVRLHGAPRMYYSSYDSQAIERVKMLLDCSGARDVWCIFDNTASGAAAHDALLLQQLLER